METGILDEKILKGWKNPGKNCGACGEKSCEMFEKSIISGEKKLKDCPFYKENNSGFLTYTKQSDNPTEKSCNNQVYSGYDILNIQYDFVLHPIPDEPSARKIILPFRPELAEKLNIQKDDILLGRPQGAGCPVQHILSVIKADFLTGVITSHVVSPVIARENPDRVKEIRAYHIIGFEGIAQNINSEPLFGRRQRFLPGFCMMNLCHTGVVNMCVNKKTGLHVRVEDIRII